MPGFPPRNDDCSPDELPLRLQRTLRSRHVAMIAIGGIIGAGLFVGSSASIAMVGPAVILSYIAAGFMVLLVMRMLSEMAATRPEVQSFPEFARLSLGHWAGFMSGWLYWYSWVVALPIEAIAGATIIQKWYPYLQIWQIGAGLMALLTIVNLFSARSYGEFEFWFSSLKIAAIVVFILLGASYATGLTSPHGATFENLTAHGGFMPHGPLAVLTGITGVIFALCGAEISTIAAAESSSGPQTIARMTNILALRILFFYVISIGLIVSIVPWTSIVPGESPFAAALAAMHIPGVELVMDIVVLIAVLSCLNSGLYVTSRVLFVLSANGDAPKWLVKINDRRVPARAIVTGTLFGYGALAASVLSPQIVFSFLVNASGAIMLVIYLLIAASQIRLRSGLEKTAPERLRVRMWLHPWGSLATILGMAAVLGAMAVTPEHEAEFYASLIVVIIVGLGYLARQRLGLGASVKRPAFRG
jgi:GABA permease